MSGSGSCRKAKVRALTYSSRGFPECSFHIEFLKPHPLLTAPSFLVPSASPLLLLVLLLTINLTLFRILPPPNLSTSFRLQNSRLLKDCCLALKQDGGCSGDEGSVTEAHFGIDCFRVRVLPRSCPPLVFSLLHPRCKHIYPTSALTESNFIYRRHCLFSPEEDILLLLRILEDIPVGYTTAWL